MRFPDTPRPSRGRIPAVLVVSLDGVPCMYVQRLFGAGELPNLRAIVEGGALAQMDTTVPNVSSVAWASFMTGLNPGQAQIYGFVDRRPGTKKTYIPTARDVRAPTISSASASRASESSR